MSMFELKWISYGEKGLHLKMILGEPILIVELPLIFN